MNGNVWEWVEDCYYDSYNGEGLPDDGSAWTGEDCLYRVVRWSSWDHNRERDIPDFRLGMKSDDQRERLGFRLARTLSQSESVTP